MARARGSDATMQLARESTYGVPPVSGYDAVPFVSSGLGATRGLIESDLLGQGRRPFDPTPDVTNNDGDVTVPIDPTFFGHWLRLLFGAPTTTGSGDPYTHTFISGAAALPSNSIHIGHPRVPSFSTSYGVRANTLRIDMRRGGLVNATIGCIAKGETTPGGTTAIPAPDPLYGYTRFPQASGLIKLDGSQLGSVVSGSINYSNSLDKIETIQPDGEIEDADPGMPMANGNVTLRFADNVLMAKAISGVPVELEFAWSAGPYSLVINMLRVFLPRPKREISGPAGIMASFDYQASASDYLLRATIVSPTPSFA